MFYPNLDTLQAVSVTTAACLPTATAADVGDARPANACVSLAADDPVRRFAAGVSIGEPDAVGSVRRTTPVGVRRIVRRHRPRVSPAWLLLAGGIVRSTRLERGQDVSMPSRARTLTSHVTYKATPRDDVRLFAQVDGLSSPATDRAALVNPALAQTTRSMLLSTTWDRTARVG
jgi:hypothetical protein